MLHHYARFVASTQALSKVKDIAFFTSFLSVSYTLVSIGATASVLITSAPLFMVPSDLVVSVHSESFLLVPGDSPLLVSLPPVELLIAGSGTHLLKTP